jgi:hypothetical protein
LSRGSVQIRSPQFVTSTLNPDQVAVHQLPQNLAATDAPHGFDFGSANGLPIGHHRQRLQGRRGKPRRRGQMPLPPQPTSELWTGQQLKSACHFLHAKGSATPVVRLIQQAD